MRSRIVALSLLLTCCSCSRSPTKPAEVVDVEDPIAHLRAFESARRSEARFSETAPQDRAFGPDPYDVVALGPSLYAGILRGRDRLTVFDGDGKEIAQRETPRAPSGIAARESDLFVVSEIEPVVARFHLTKNRTLERLSDIALGADVYGVRDVATGPEGVVYAIDEHDGRLFTHSGPLGRVVERRVQRGPLRVARTRQEVIVASLFDHDIALYAVDRSGIPLEGPPAATTKIDGPYWGLSAIDLDGDNVLIVAGGVEDHALDRKGGFFGYVDSFVYGYRFTRGKASPNASPTPAKPKLLERVFAINVGEHGLILPKAIALSRTGAFVTSYGGSKALQLRWSESMDDLGAPRVTVVAGPPGCSAIARASGDNRLVAANPLLDAWVFFDPDGHYRTARLRDPDDRRAERERLGEALFFTELMAPASSSDAAKSRFTCETCHFEGYVDGRIHHTGRGEIHAVTKPLVGLFNNRPHFSRALDPDLSAVAENEFRVAGAPSPTDPHFDIDAKSVPWLAQLGIEQRRYDASELRLSLMAFLMRFSHRTNPRAARLGSFGDLEKRGASLFRDRCERCHQARTAADDASSRVPFDRWESAILNGGAIVWASDAYEKTGIEPYVHERGARVPSLRRLYKKHPYFTNGSADTLVDVLRRARLGEPFSHHGDADGQKLDDESVKAIAAFVDLL